MMLLQIAAGFVLLLGGADALVRGAVDLARRLNVSTLVIGMTVVAFGTSAPEFVVSLNAAWSGSPGIALGNVIGSNVANVLLILGTAALVMPIPARQRPLYMDSAVLTVGTLLFAGAIMLGQIDRLAGGVLTIAFLAFLFSSYWREMRGDKDVAAASHSQEVEEAAKRCMPLWLAWIALIGGIAGVVFGADLLVGGGVALARMYGISEAVIGLTLIAVGTSLPELAASVMAARRGHSDVAVGNVLGSNLFNMLGVIGPVAIVAPLTVPAEMIAVDIWVMLGATILMMPLLLSRRRFSRAGGFLFLALYAGYMVAQAMRGTGAAALGGAG